MATVIPTMTQATQSQTPTPTTSLTTSRSPSPKPRHTPPPGLGNLGNTCYLNSVVQVLYHILPFRTALLSWSPPDKPSFASELVDCLRQVFVSLDRAQLAADTLTNSYDSLPRRSPSPPIPSAAHRTRPPPSRTRTPPPTQPNASSSHQQEYFTARQDTRHGARHDTRVRHDLPDNDYDQQEAFCDDEDGFLGDDEEELNDAVIDPNTEPQPADGTREGIDFINPQNIIGLLRDENRCTEFDARGQQDAHEFLRFLLDKVNDCFQKSHLDQSPPTKGEAVETPGNSVVAPVSATTANPASKPNDSATAADEPLKKIQLDERSPASKRRRYDQEDGKQENMHEENAHSAGCAQSSKEGPLKNSAPSNTPAKRPRKRYQQNLVKELFEGKAVTATRCDECECHTERSEQFLDVSLPVEAGKSLAWAWSSQGAREKLDGENKYSCENCQTYTEAQRWWQVAELPEVLTVHLKLFAFDAYPGAGGKVPVAMPCPVSMKFSEWCSNDCAEQDDVYNLSAVIVHEGTGASSGHYYSYIYKPDKGGWFIFDDNVVTPVAEAEMNERLFTSMRSRRTAYVLFYTHGQQQK